MVRLVREVRGARPLSKDAYTTKRYQGMPDMASSKQ